MSLPRHTVSVTLTEAQLARLDALGDNINHSRSEIIMIALAAYDMEMLFHSKSKDEEIVPSVFQASR